MKAQTIKYCRVILFLFLTLVPAIAQEKVECPAFRDGEIIIRHTGFTLSYNPETMLPDWVAYELEAGDLEGDAVRKPSFSPDPSPELRGYELAQHYHYSHSGWVRGHMVPAGDLKYDQAAMDDSFYTTNVCPMNMQFNNGIWKRLEEVCRRWAREYGHIYIVTGPIVGGNVNGKVGDSGIVVPDAFFKAVLVPVGDGFLSIGFRMENAEGTKGRLRDFTCTVVEVEDAAGLVLFPSVDGEPGLKRQVPLKELGLY